MGEKAVFAARGDIALRPSRVDNSVTETIRLTVTAYESSVDLRHLACDIYHPIIPI